MAGAPNGSVAAHRGPSRQDGRSGLAGGIQAWRRRLPIAVHGPRGFRSAGASRRHGRAGSCVVMREQVRPAARRFSASGPKNLTKTMIQKEATGSSRGRRSSLLALAARFQRGRLPRPGDLALARSAPIPSTATARSADRPQAAFAVRKNCIFSEAIAEKSSTCFGRLSDNVHLDEPSDWELGKVAIRRFGVVRSCSAASSRR